MLTRNLIEGALSYDSGTGIFLRKKNGETAGNIANNGYRSISINVDGKRQRCLAHRLAWVLVHGYFPKTDVDHIDGNRDNNAIANLRLATRSQNLGNSKRRTHNSSGFKGVHFHKHMKVWRARITFQGKEIFLGHYPSAELAHEAYVVAAKRLFGEFARAA